MHVLISFSFSLVSPSMDESFTLPGSTQPQINKTYLNVSVATLWKEPGTKRIIDQHVLENPVNMKMWTAKMPAASDRIWLTGKTETQGLYGQEVTIVKTSGNWAKVLIKDQATDKNSSGYPGWLPKSQIAVQNAGYTNCPIASVKSKTAVLSYDKNKPFMEISFNTRLPIVKAETNWLQVMTPANQTKWLRKKDVNVYPASLAIPKPKGSDLVSIGKMFIGLPYLWSGVSSYGFDCSGFTYSIYRYYGMNIPRDASEQIKAGRAVSKTKLQPGDLIFFAGDNGKGTVHHVAMYTGDGNMLHSPKAGKRIEMIPVNTPSYKQEYAGARRYIE